MSMYLCDGCQETIPVQKARVHCQTCPGSYDLCANCFVIGVATQGHATNHSMYTLRASGLASAPGQPYVGSQQTLAQQAPQTQPAGTSQLYPPQQRAGWQALFNSATWTPTADYVSLAQSIFNHLDSKRTGYLSPEAYSSLLDVLGVTGPQNVWRYAYENGFGSSKEGQADYALKQVFDSFSIDHALQPRQPPSPGQNQPSLSNLLGAFAGSALPSSQMPLLTLRGFIDLATLDALSNPSKAVNDLNRILHTYQLPIWREKGDIPRWALPDAPVKHVVDKMSAAVPSPSATSQHYGGMPPNLVSQLQLADDSRFAANQIGQDSTYEYVRRQYY